MGERLSLKDFDRLVHDMKTPVNTVTGRLQMALSRIEDETTRRYVLQGAAGAVNLLRKFYNLYYLVALKENPKFPQKSSVLLPEVWRQASKTWVPLAGVMGITVSGDMPEGLAVSANKDVLVRMFDNLFSNALLHSRNAGLVSIRVERSGDVVNVVFRNDGNADREEGEVEMAEPDFSEGYTVNRLGLVAVRALAERLGGGFNARHASGGSFIATLSLPVGE